MYKKKKKNQVKEKWKENHTTMNKICTQKKWIFHNYL